ncbi:MAG: hypothetical protein LBH93_01350, partial [Chitinispirillales bacterium]|nr:hypothetical protein [Chitinispirillales bacterium]
MPFKRFSGIVLGAVALVAGGLISGCTENGNSAGNQGNGGSAADYIVGAWEIPGRLTDEDPSEYRTAIDIKPSGEVLGYTFMRVGDGWVEEVDGVDEEQVRWRVDGKRLYFSVDGEEEGSVPYAISKGVFSIDTTIPGEGTVSITISGKKLTVESCEGGACESISLTRTTIA